MYRRSFLRPLFAICIAAAAPGVIVDAQPPSGVIRLDRALRGASGDVQVIVRARPGLKAAVRKRLRSHGTIVKEHRLIEAITARVRTDRLSALSRDGDIESVSLDAPMIDTAVPGQIAIQSLPGSQLAASLGLPVKGVTGRGVGIAVIDSGIEPNGDFGRVAFFDFTPLAGHHPYDDYGHGTQLSGLIASSGALSQTPAGPVYRGMAPKARIISLKVLDSNGVAMTSSVIAAIEFAIQYKNALGIDVINLSLGHPILEPAATDPLVRIVEAASKAGIVVVVAAGNVGKSPTTGRVGYAGILSPGNAESAITVGALDGKNSVTRVDDAVADYSSRGPTFYDGRPKPDFVAPGQNLVSDAALGSTLYLEHPDHVITLDGSKAKFLRLSGTSLAAAVTSGVAALVIEAARQSGATPTPQLVKEILSYTATPLSGYDALTQGHGTLNAAGAVAVARALGPSTPTSTWWTSNRIAPYTIVAGEVWRWSQETTFPGDLVKAWANSIHWASSGGGDTIVWGTHVGLGSNTIVWGTMWSFDGDTIVWGTMVGFDGDTIVWGTTIDGDTIVWGTTVDANTALLWGTGWRNTPIGSK